MGDLPAILVGKERGYGLGDISPRELVACFVTYGDVGCFTLVPRQRHAYQRRLLLPEAVCLHVKSELLRIFQVSHQFPEPVGSVHQEVLTQGLSSAFLEKGELSWLPLGIPRLGQPVDQGSKFQLSEEFHHPIAVEILHTACFQAEVQREVSDDSCQFPAQVRLIAVFLQSVSGSLALYLVQVGVNLIEGAVLL